MKTLLQLENIHKSFGSNQVLKGIDLSFRPGEVTGLIGSNGAGKSTLMKIVSGKISQSEGQILWKGEKVDFTRPLDAIERGIIMIPQELGLAPELTALENIMLGQYSANYGVINQVRANKQVKELLQLLKADFPTNIPVGQLSPGHQQLTAIARALKYNSEFLIFDEPTSMLTENEADKLSLIIQGLKEKGVAIVYISHRFPEILKNTDRVIALRDGVISGQGETDEITELDLIHWMVGGKEKTSTLAQIKGNDEQSNGGEVVLQVSHLSTSRINDVSFNLKKGEILGLVGLMGSGRTEIIHALAGIDAPQSGEIKVKGKKLKGGSVRESINHGILLSPEDRRSEGLFLDQTISFNTFVPNSLTYSTNSILAADSQEQSFRDTLKTISVQAQGPDQLAGSLSGGNQQRLILGKLLLKGGDIFLLDEITMGVDLMTIREILKKMVELSKEGKSIIFSSSEWSEVTSVADRILIINEGKIISEYERKDFDKNAFMRDISQVHEAVI